MALRDVMGWFEQEQKHRLQSSDLVSWLVEMEDRPWGEWKKGRPMTANSLSRLLKPFGIRPRKIRFGGGTFMGYERAPVEAAFARYCQQPPAQTGTPEQTHKTNGLDQHQAGTREDDVPVCNHNNPLEDKDCSGVPLSRGRSRAEWADFQ